MDSRLRNVSRDVGVAPTMDLFVSRDAGWVAALLNSIAVLSSKLRIRCAYQPLAGAFLFLLKLTLQRSPAEIL